MTKIEWTEKTWNPIIGCTKVSEGCKNCYAEKASIRLSAMNQPCSPDYSFILKYADYGKPLGFNGKTVIRRDKLNEPLKWRKPQMVFVNSMSDLFHESIPFKTIDEIFDVMCAELVPKRGKRWYECEDESDYREVAKHTYQILTKRPERMLKFFDWAKENCDIDSTLMVRMKENDGELPQNIWLGVSVENQKAADERIPMLLQSPAKVKFLSIEPMLGMTDLSGEWSEYRDDTIINTQYRTFWLSGIDWIIVGCESGAKRRPCKIEWVESIVKQCRDAGVPVFVKQLDLDGKVEKDINVFPEHLRIREFPK